MSSFCNAYGAESWGGPSAFGGFLPNPIALANICREPAVHRFTWVCEHGHRGRPVSLCEQHYGEFTGAREVRNSAGHMQGIPYNVRRDVQACPRCAAEAPGCDNPDHRAFAGGEPCGCRQHKCAVRLVTVS